MSNKIDFASGLKYARIAKGLTQESFSDISSRTYISSLERSLKSPTLEKVEQLAAVLDMHPITLIALGYIDGKDDNLRTLIETIKNDLKKLSDFNGH